MSLDNPLWGGARIHGELLKLGFQVAQSTVAKYIETARRTAGSELVDVTAQSHALNRGDGPVRGADACLQPALRLHHRSARPSRARLDCRDEQPDGGLDLPARLPRRSWESPPRDLIRDRDRVFGSVVRQRLRAMGIRDKVSRLARRGRTVLPKD